MVGLRRHLAHTGDRNFTLSLAAIFNPSRGVWNPSCDPGRRTSTLPEHSGLRDVRRQGQGPAACRH